MVIDALKRILSSQSGEMPTIDSSDLPKFPAHSEWPADPVRLKALATETLAEVARRQQALPTQAAIEDASEQVSASRARLQLASTQAHEKTSLEARIRALTASCDVYRMVTERLEECQRNAQSALGQANGWLNCERDLKDAARREKAALEAQTAAETEAARFEDARTKIEQTFATLQAERKPLAAERDDLLADQAAGSPIDADRLAELRGSIDQLDRSIVDYSSVLDAISRKVAAAQAKAEQAAKDTNAAQEEMRRLEGICRERDIRQTVAAAAELIRSRMPKAGADVYERIRVCKTVLNRLTDELVRG